MASEGDHISITFARQDSAGLWLALVIGLIAIAYGLIVVRSSVLAQSPGNEKMQEVGLAIRQGALAYLKQQIQTMVWFIILLALGLLGLNWRLGPPLSAGIAGCFVAGVISSYVSGYAGMLMAVAGNMRTAHAALSSFALATRTAFRSGAVAGLVTVGIGLSGASIILLAFPGYATNLLIGYGFGASLAALFMRVGGGIFTKAADVGADLVGKIEQGIPEDDPRNPATIADNVGDNVGDCAGMAADVFESYEVTLVAAIILGAATAAVLDPLTWPRLIVFALAAAAAGLLASLFAISVFKGSDDPHADPFKLLNRSFRLAGILSILLVGGVAFFLFGRPGSQVATVQLVPQQQYRADFATKLLDIQASIARAKKEQPYDVSNDDMMADPRTLALGLDKKADEPRLAQLMTDPSTLPPMPDLSGMSEVSLNNLADPNNLALSYGTRPMPPIPSQNGDQFTSVGKAFQNAMTGGHSIAVAQIHVQIHQPPRPASGRMPAMAGQDIDIHPWVGPWDTDVLQKQLQAANDQAKKQGGSITIEKQIPVKLFTSPDGKIALGVEADQVQRADELGIAGGLPNSYFKLPFDKLNDRARGATADKPPAMPAQSTIELALVTHHAVPFYMFWLMVVFGILMAFAIDFITGRYVDTHKRPTQEVAGVASAGAAPMIIQGFALALQSSVYTVVAIVVALLFPVLIFNPVTYGGYALSFYGITLVGVGLLTTTAFILAMDTFGPISDNAQGVFEMSGAAAANPQAAKIVAHLDAAGNTTKALTKGFAITTAVVAAVALFHSYLAGAQLTTIGLRLDVPEIFLGLLIGGAAPYLFSAFAINAVGRAAFELIGEVRRQFRADPGIMQGTSRPDYARCVALVTSAAQKELLSPGILAIALPIAVGFGFGIGKPLTTINGHQYNLVGAEALGGFLAGAIVSGQLMAVLLSNAGGMWDNAKKLIEDGMHGGKGTEAHKAAIIGDTIGDPFKDTAGPALNPLIKVMNLVALLISGAVIQPFGLPIEIGITVVAVGLLVLSIFLADRGSMSSLLAAAQHSAAEVADATVSSPLPATAAGPCPAPGK